MNITCSSRFLLHALAALILSPILTATAAPNTGPWDLAALKKTPAATWGTKTGLVQQVFYEGESFNSKPTRIFAYLGRPAEGQGPFPAMVLVHGGGGKAFREWAEHWAKRGYVALAMDTAGHGPNGPLPDGGPGQGDDLKFRNFTESEAREMWTYHAVAAVIRGNSLLASLPEVDPARIGITGISWGGYLTCIVAGLDDRLKVAVPVYGCGFLGDNSVWKNNSLAAMKPDARQLWLRLFDPSQYLSAVNCPILFLNGSNDFAYPMDSYQKSYRLVRHELRHLSMVIQLPHGHIWNFAEVDTFVDSVLKKGESIPSLRRMTTTGSVVSANFKSPLPIKQAFLHYTTNSGAWQKRQWTTIPAKIDQNTITANLPTLRPVAWYLSLTDDRGIRVSTEHMDANLLSNTSTGSDLRTNFRRPETESDWRYWLESMVRFHRFSPEEVSAATGLTIPDASEAIKKYGLNNAHPQKRQPNEPLRVMPYPGGRHPRIGFLEGAIDPQRETKISVFTPWDDMSYVVMDVPEAIFSNLGLTYLAHTHIPTIWSQQGVELPRLEWNRRPDGALDFERTLPNGIAFGTKVWPRPSEVRLELWLRNGTSAKLNGLKVQNCVMLKMVEGANQQVSTNKVFGKMSAGVRLENGQRWIITAWQRCERAWGNEQVPCAHADPRFPDCAPGETVRLHGWLGFYEGPDVIAEFKRIEDLDWLASLSSQ